MGSHLEETDKKSCVNNYFELFEVIILVITTLIFFSVKVFSGDIYCLCPQQEQIIVYSKVKLLHLVRNHEQKRVLK